MFQLRSNSLLGALFCLMTAATAAQAEIGSSMVTYLNENLNNRLGGGESEHLATEALRVNEGEFINAELGVDSPATGDYVWGTLITVISYSNQKWSDSNPTAACQPGDIIQYGGSAEFGTTKYATHHTSVVNTVSASTQTAGSRPTAVFQQNFNNVRTVQNAAIDTKQLTAGWLRIYRPKAREDVTNTYKITLVNKTTDSQHVKVMVDNTTINSFTLTPANTASSFLSYTVSTTGTVPCLVHSDNITTIYMQTAKGNSIANAANGSVNLLQLNQ